MEIVFTSIAIMLLIIYSDSGNLFIIGSSIALAILPWVIAYIFSTTTYIEHTDVLEHKGTTYASPKVFTETIIDAPFWSCQDSRYFTLKSN